MAETGLASSEGSEPGFCPNLILFIGWVVSLPPEISLLSSASLRRPALGTGSGWAAVNGRCQDPRAPRIPKGPPSPQALLEPCG